MRILLVSQVYRPLVSARTLRWGSIAERWAARGHEVHVVTGWVPNTSRQETLKKVFVYRVGGSVTERLRSRLSASPEQQTDANHSVAEAKPALLRKCARTTARFFHDFIWKKIYWPDHACLWNFPAVRKANELLDSRNFDVLITSSLPFTCHLAGLRLKRRFPDVPWVVDVGDPFSFMKENPVNNFFLYQRLNHMVEKRVFERADTVSVTTRETAEIYQRLFPRKADAVHVIPPLLREESLIESTGRIFPVDDRIRLVFVGTLYANIRPPQRLLETFVKLLRTDIGNRLELHFYGHLNGCDRLFDSYRSLIGNALFLHGNVDHSTACRAMQEADFLVNIGNTTAYQLPSKVVEYAWTGKPVLNFSTTPTDSSASFLKTYPAIFSLPYTDEQTGEAGPRVSEAQLQQLVTFLKQRHGTDPEQIKSWCKPFQLEAISRQYEILIEEARSCCTERRNAGSSEESLPEQIAA